MADALELTVGKVYAHDGRLVVALVLREGKRLVWWEGEWKTARWDDLDGGQQDAPIYAVVGSWGITTRELDAFLAQTFVSHGASVAFDMNQTARSTRPTARSWSG